MAAPDMENRLLFDTPDQESQELLDSMLSAALELTPLTVRAEYVTTQSALLARANAEADDVIVLDWLMAQADTPTLVATLLCCNPKLRIVALPSESYRQYRRQVWQAGACSSIAKETMEQEWFSSVLCIMHWAMEREARLHAFCGSDVRQLYSLAKAYRPYGLDDKLIFIGQKAASISDNGRREQLTGRTMKNIWPYS